MTKIEFKNIDKYYENGFHAVKKANFTAEKGEFVVLVGPSGCGKSTILKIIAGLEKPSGGEIYFNDKMINELEPKDRNIGMVFQNYALYPHLTIFENLAFPLKIQKVKKDIIKKSVEDNAALLGLSEYLKKKPKELSGGQRQRVALGRAIIKKPNVFLFDEPLSNLDAKLRVSMRTEIVNLSRNIGITSIYVTHDQTEAMTMASKLIVMNNGEIQQIGSPAEIYNEPENLFTASFIGSPQINIFEGRIIKDNNNDYFSEINNGIKLKLPNINSKYENSKVSLAVRPENINFNNSDVLPAFQSEVINIENLGYEHLIYFSSNDSIKCLRTNNINHNLKINDNISIIIKSEDVLLFDEEGKRIR